MADRYFRANSSSVTWNTTNTAIWSDTPTGPTGASVPTSADNVYVGSFSYNTSYTLIYGSGITCANLSIVNPSSGTVTVSHAADINVYGDISYASNILVSGTSYSIALRKTTGTCLVNLNNLKYQGVVNFNGGSTTIFQLQSNLWCRQLGRPVGIFSANGYKVTTTGSITSAFTGTSSFYDLDITEPYYNTGDILISANITITNNFKVKGTDTTRVYIRTAFLAGITITSANNVGWEYADLSAITGAGTASWDLSAIPGGSGDCGNNVGITFTPGVTQYWYRNTGNWKDPTKWFSQTNGGGTQGRRPLPQDNCIFDENSFSLTAQTVTSDYPNICKDFDCRNVTNSPSFNVANSVSPIIYGHCYCGTITSFFSGSSPITFRGIGITEFLPPSFGTAQIDILKVNPAGIKLMGNLLIGSTLNPGTLFPQRGSLDMNGYNVRCGGVSWGISGWPVSLYMGSGTLEISLYGGLTDLWSVGGSFSVFNRGTSTLLITGGTSSARNLNLGGRTFYNLVLNYKLSNNGSITFGQNNNTFNSITIYPQVRLGFYGSTTQTAGTYNIMRGARLYRASGTTNYILAKSGGGTVDMSYMNITNMTGSPVSTFNAVNSVNAGGNTNITFTKDDRDYQRFLA